jgi:hypothetical protein
VEFPEYHGRAEVHTSPCRRLGIIHGLYWLTVNLAEQQPVAIVVDDVQIRETSSTVKCMPVRALHVSEVIVNRLGLRRERFDGRTQRDELRKCTVRRRTHEAARR